VFGVKRPLKRLKKKERDEKKTIPVFHPNFNLFSKATVVSCPRPVYTPSIVYGRIFTTQTPFYNVAISRYIAYRSQRTGPSSRGLDHIILIGLAWIFISRVIEFL